MATLQSYCPVYVVVGGGIAGVSCAEELSSLDTHSSIIIVSSSPLIKTVTNFTKISRSIEQFDVYERPSDSLTSACPRVTVIHSGITSLNTTDQTISLANGGSIKYDKLCICTGGVPKVISKDNPYVIGIRDTESVQEFQKKLGNARRILVVGNGGIAVELVYEVSGCEVVWAIKDKSIGQTFFDEGAATFFLPHLSASKESTPEPDQPTQFKVCKRAKYTVRNRHVGRKEGEEESEGFGSALGPDWSSDYDMTGSDLHKMYRHVHVEYECEVAKIHSPADLKSRSLKSSNIPCSPEVLSQMEAGEKDKRNQHAQIKDVKLQDESETLQATATPIHARICSEYDKTTECTDKNPVILKTSVNAEYTEKTPVDFEWPVYVELSNGKVYGCDLIVSATGVVPNTSWIKEAIKNKRETIPELADGGGIIVDSAMRSSVPNVYAAGDVCTVNWSEQSNTWFPMRLWTQARQMGAYAARCMDSHYKNASISLDFCFELFAHVTQFFGYKVVLLGRYNGQGLDRDCELLVRCTKGLEYVKVVLQNGRMVGAILIGETDLEETFENLILNGMDLTRFGESLLDPDIDIEDYFD